MPKRYIRVNNGNGWKNKPSIETPLGQVNLNQMDKGIDDVDNALLSLENNMPQKMSEAITAAESSIIGNLTVGVNTAISSANTATTNTNNAGTNANNKAALAEQKAQAAQSIVDAATPIINANLQATYSDKATGMTGTAIQCVVADDALVDISSIKGASTQVVTEQGKNLFDKNRAQNVGKGVSTSSGELYTDSALLTTYYIPVNPSTVYSISHIKFGAFYNASKQYISGFSTTPFTTPSTAYFIRYSMLLEVVKTFQVELGSVATAYESFTPNSPSPEYPSPITSAGDAAFDIVTCNNNLLPKFSNRTVNGLTMAVAEDGTITLNGTATATTNFYADNSNSIDFLSLQSLAYTLSLNNPASESMVSIHVRKDSADGTKAITSTCSVINRSITVTPILPYIANRCFIQVISGATLSNFTLKPQLELGSIVTNYKLPKSNKLTVSGLPMGSLPNGVCDEVVRNADGSYKHIKLVNTTIFNGSELGWASGAVLNDTLVFYLSGGLAGSLITPTLKLMCDKFIRTTHGNTSDYEHIRGSSGAAASLYLYINKSRLPTQDLAGFKTWLAANPITVKYQLATPIETPLPSSYKLTSYKGVTNVFTTAPVQPVLTADFRSELWTNDYFTVKTDGNKAIDHLTVGSRKTGSTVGVNSFVSGKENEASAPYSASEGQYNIASGINGSRAGGNSTKATGESSRSDGVLTEANAFASSAGGFGTKANGSSQSVVGRFNAPNTSDLFQVGMGTSDSDRKNAMRVTSAGDVIMAGLIKSPSFKWLGFVYPSDINNLYVAFTDSVDACAYGCFLVDNGLALIIGYEYTSGMYGYQLKMMFDNTLVKRDKYNSLTWSSWAPIA